jgi:hypothetical protein
MEEGMNAFKTLADNLQERDLQEGLGVNGRTILQWILNKELLTRGIGFIWLRIGIIGEPL